jgi:lysyl-tRNA synthetase class 2
VVDETGDLISQRKAKAEELRRRGVEPYPYIYHPTHTAADIQAQFGGQDALPEGVHAVVIAGRMLTRRHLGKVCFAHVQDSTARIQIYVRQDAVGPEAYDLFLTLDLGDIVGVEGSVFRTRAGELTVQAIRVTLLAKSLRPLPEKWHGLQDVELRYRQRYVDLIVNPDVREVFRKRAQVIQAMRDFLNARGFLEVETPILQPVYGGASARPFTTQHHALNRTLYLRISNELYLKRLVVGGLERVYEFSTDFRNEGMDRSHNPEFTLMECYQAYADYETMMLLAEEMLVHTAKAVVGTLTVEFQSESLDFTPPWRRLRMVDAIRAATGVDVLSLDVGGLRAALRQQDIADIADPDSWGRMVAQLFEERAEDTLVQPTILYDYPVEVSPLAKKKRGDPRFVERFEPYVARMEIGNAFSELNDPMDQRARFDEQMRMREKGDQEAMVLDEDYLRALEYGMPPTGGLGIGVDRLTMLLTDSASIRDVLLFPQMRPES